MLVSAGTAGQLAFSALMATMCGAEEMGYGSMRTQILQVSICAALLVCAIGIAAFARAAYESSPHKPHLERPGASAMQPK